MVTVFVHACAWNTGFHEIAVSTDCVGLYEQMKTQCCGSRQLGAVDVGDWEGHVHRDNITQMYNIGNIIILAFG